MPARVRSDAGDGAGADAVRRDADAAVWFERW